MVIPVTWRFVSRRRALPVLWRPRRGRAGDGGVSILIAPWELSRTVPQGTGFAFRGGRSRDPTTWSRKLRASLAKRRGKRGAGALGPPSSFPALSLSQ